MLAPTTHPNNLLQLDIRHGPSCDYHRVVLPFQHLKARPKVPVFWFNRIASGGLEKLRQLKARGVRIVMDLDDHFDLPTDHYLYQSFKRSGMSQHIVSGLLLADVVVVTTAVLAAAVAPFNNNVVIVPNALPFDTGQFTLSQDTSSSTPFVYAAGTSHYPDLQMISDYLPAHSLTIAGEVAGQAEWAKMRLCAPDQNWLPILPLSSYMTAYDGHWAAIAPLVDNPFNRCKSNLKTLEAGAKGIPLIASDIHPYRNWQDQQHVVFCASPSDWHREIKAMTPAKAEDCGQALSAHVREHYQLRDANELRRQIIESFT